MNWRRGLKWLNFTLFIPFLVILLLIYILLFTQLGLTFTVWTAEKFVKELTIASSSGRLLGHMQLNDVQWQQDENNRIKLKQLDLHLKTRCLLAGSVCVEQLLLDGLAVNLTSSEQVQAESNSIQPIFIPLPLLVSQLVITNADIKLDGNKLNWHKFSAKIDAWGSKVQLDDVLWQQVTVTPALTAEASSTVAATTTTVAEPESFSYKALQLEEISLPLAVYISQFTLTDFTLLTETPQHIPLLQLAVQAQRQQINLTQFHLQHQQLTIDATMLLNMKNNYPLTAQIDVVLLEQPLAEQKLSINLNGDFADLHINATASNNINAQLDANLALLTDNLPLNLSLNAAKNNTLALDDDTNINLNATKLSLDGDLQLLHLSAATNYKLSNMPSGNISLKAAITPTNANIEKLLIRGLEGQAQLAATVDWQQALQWQANLQLKHINPGVLLPDYAGDINGQVIQQGTLNTDGSWTVNLSKLDINGNISNLPFILRGDLTAQSSSLDSTELIDNISFNTNKLSLMHGQNNISFSGGLAKNWQLNADINIPDISKSVAQASGLIYGKINASGPRLSPKAVATIDATNLSYQQFSLETLQLNSDIQLDKDISANFQLVAKQGRYQDYSLEQLSINAQGNEQQHQAHIVLNSNIANTDITFSGKFEREKQWLGQLNQAEISTEQGTWKLQQSANINYILAKQQAKIAQHCWQQQATTLCLIKPASISAEQGEFALLLNDFSLTTLNTLMPASIETEGLIQVNTQASWQPNSAPKVNLILNGGSGNLKLNDAKAVNLPWQAFTLQLDSADELTTQFVMNFTDKARIKANAVITELMQDERKIAGELNIDSFSLAFLQPLFDSSSQVKADVNSQLQFNGLLAAPDLTGTISVDNIKVSGKNAPTEIENGSVALQFEGETAGINGSLNTPDGSISLTGDANWQDISDWQAIMRLSGDALALQIPNISLKVKPDLKVEITPKLTLITGIVEVPSANISIDDLPQSAVGISSDTILLDNKGVPMERDSSAPIPIHTDIKVILNKDVKLQAFGLVTKLSGELSVKQQDKGPQIYGEVALIDGTFRSYGQDLLIRRGKLKFDGPADQPYLDIEAIRNPESTEDDVIAGIKVVGPADEPLVTIFSEPSKPQANALSYLIAGRDIGSDSGSASDALTTSLIGMSIASSSKLVGNIGAAFGINDLSLDTAGAGNNSQVTVSGHLSRDLELKYGYGIFNAVGEFTLRYRIMRRLYLESVSGLDNTVDLLYKFEFD